ncbi:MAG: hypothetical protein JWR51_848 [Devosia sp.]|uniref:SRPBCC family protein n=1 Tax=Devosia sp. TaxID=1871048 RepID=UPI00260FADC1|nr:SRPBCC family protein [Devosia sp.]MDB5527745.1 hypothetical protein [Devosia sp.]
MAERSIVHGTFTVERHYPASPKRVFQAWADPKIKAKWFGTSPEDTKEFDFRVGGREYAEGKGPNDSTFSFDVSYRDIVPDNRIIYTYEMALGGPKISVSVAAVELRPEGDGTHMIVTEHGCFLDGLDTMEQRRHGTEWLMDQLGEELKRQMAS